MKCFSFKITFPCWLVHSGHWRRSATSCQKRAEKMLLLLCMCIGVCVCMWISVHRYGLSSRNSHVLTGLFHWPPPPPKRKTDPPPLRAVRAWASRYCFPPRLSTDPLTCRLSAAHRRAMWDHSGLPTDLGPASQTALRGSHGTIWPDTSDRLLHRWLSHPSTLSLHSTLLFSQRGLETGSGCSRVLTELWIGRNEYSVFEFLSVVDYPLQILLVIKVKCNVTFQCSFLFGWCCTWFKSLLRVVGYLFSDILGHFSELWVLLSTVFMRSAESHFIWNNPDQI